MTLHPIIRPAHDNNCPLQNDGANTTPCLLVSSILLVDSNVSVHLGSFSTIVIRAFGTSLTFADCLPVAPQHFLHMVLPRSTTISNSSKIVITERPIHRPNWPPIDDTRSTS